MSKKHPSIIVLGNPSIIVLTLSSSQVVLVLPWSVGPRQVVFLEAAYDKRTVSPSRPSRLSNTVVAVDGLVYRVPELSILASCLRGAFILLVVIGVLDVVFGVKVPLIIMLLIASISMSDVAVKIRSRLTQGRLYVRVRLSERGAGRTLASPW